MLKGINQVLGSIVIIAVVALLHCTNASYEAGQNTPVWTARCTYSVCDKYNPVTYERLETGAVKRAVDYLNSGKLINLRSRRDIQALDDLEQAFAGIHNYEHLVRRDTDDKVKAEVKDEYDYEDEGEVDELLPGNATRPSGLSTGINTVRILVVSQYKANEVTDDASREKYINDKILYILAYWHMYTRKVLGNRNRNNYSKIRIKIVGIIIALDRGATTYLKPDSGTAGYISDSSYKMDALSDSNEYWNSPPAEFPKEAFHAVVTMTDIRPPDEEVGFFDCVPTIRPGSGTVMVWDTNSFRAVGERTSIVGFQQCLNTLYGWSRRKLQIPDYMQPGRPVTVLPGQVFSAEQQCRLHGYFDLDRLCPEYSENCVIWCLNSGFLKSCGSIGTALEGTPCKNGRVG